MTAEERIARLEYTLGTLIGWLLAPGVLAEMHVQQLLRMLADEDPLMIPTALRRKS